MRVWCQENVYSAMLQDAKDKYPLETGGVLLGYVSESGDIVINDMIGAGPNAKHERYTFEHDYEYQRKMVDEKWKVEPFSYLGDWHTHPDGIVAMSELDWNCMDAIKNSKEALCDNPVILIIGGDNFSDSSAFVHSTKCGHEILRYS